jgi:hypothetical protein
MLAFALRVAGALALALALPFQAGAARQALLLALLVVVHAAVLAGALRESGTRAALAEAATALGWLSLACNALALLVETALAASGATLAAGPLAAAALHCAAGLVDAL